MSNANRDYAIVYDVKNGSLVLNRPLIFYITDINTSNIFVRLVTKVNIGNGVDQYTDIEEASSYVLTMRVIKPNNEVKSIEATQHELGSIFQFDLTEDFKDIPGKYICELTISTIVSERQELTTSDPFNYEVKRSILSNVSEIIETEDTTVEKLLNNLEASKIKLFNDLELAKTNLHNDLNTTSSTLNSQVQANDNKIENIKEELSSQLGATKAELSSQIKEIETERFKLVFKPQALDGYVNDSEALENYINYKFGKDGICIIPEGNYTITRGITLKHGCKLVGQGNVVFNVTDLNNSAITIEDYTTIENINFYYPNQVTSGTPIPYPATIKSSNEKGCSYSIIKDINLKNSYIGIYLNTAVHKVDIKNIIGYPFYLGLYIDSSLDVVRVQNVHFNNNINGNLYSDDIIKWVLENSTAIKLKRCDNLQIDNTLVYGYNIGLHLLAGENIAGSCSMLQCNNLLIDITRQPLLIENVQDGTFFNNCYFTSFDSYKGVSGRPNIINGYASNLITDVYFNNCCFKNYLDDAILCANNIHFNNCYITDYNKLNQLYNAIKVTGDNIIINISNTTINGKNNGEARGILNTYKNSKIYINNTVIKKCDSNRAIHSDNENVYISSINTENDIYIGGKMYKPAFPIGITNA